jgi:hypothetical protein
MLLKTFRSSGDTIFKFLKEINVYIKNLLDNIRFKYMFYPFNISLICTCNPIIL